MTLPSISVSFACARHHAVLPCSLTCHPRVDPPFIFLTNRPTTFSIHAFLDSALQQSFLPSSITSPLGSLGCSSLSPALRGPLPLSPRFTPTCSHIFKVAISFNCCLPRRYDRLKFEYQDPMKVTIAACRIDCGGQGSIMSGGMSVPWRSIGTAAFKQQLRRHCRSRCML